MSLSYFLTKIYSHGTIKYYISSANSTYIKKVDSYTMILNLAVFSIVINYNRSSPSKTIKIYVVYERLGTCFILVAKWTTMSCRVCQVGGIDQLLI